MISRHTSIPPDRVRWQCDSIAGYIGTIMGKFVSNGKSLGSLLTSESPQIYHNGAIKSCNCHDPYSSLAPSTLTFSRVPQAICIELYFNNDRGRRYTQIDGHRIIYLLQRHRGHFHSCCYSLSQDPGSSLLCLSAKNRKIGSQKCNNFVLRCAMVLFT